MVYSDGMNTRQKVRKQDAVFPPVRMYAEELEWAKGQAEMSGLRVSEWGRQRLLAGFENGETPPEPEREEETTVDTRPLASEVRVPIPKPKSKKHARRS